MVTEVAKANVQDVREMSAGAQMLAKTILDIAAEVARAEDFIKAELLRAARARDHDRVENLLHRWATLPTCKVLDHSRGSCVPDAPDAERSQPGAPISSPKPNKTTAGPRALYPADWPSPRDPLD